MRYDPAKAFPYPMLRPGSSDYLDGAFQATVRWGLSEDTQSIRLRGRYQLSEPAILRLIDSGKAAYALLLESRETYFRDLIVSQDRQIETQYSGGRVKGRVEILPFVVATEPVEAFRSDWFHSDYSGATFNFEAGDVVALDAPREFYVGQEVFAPIGSVFSLVEEDEMPNGKIGLDLEGEKIQIRVAPVQKELLDSARQQRKLRPILLNSVYLPTLMQVLHFMVEDPGSFADRKWYRSIQAKCDQQGITLSESTDYLDTAQVLLGLPLVALNKNAFDGE